MTREEFIKQRCEIDKITEEEFEKQYRVIKCDCGYPYCKGYRCLDLDGLLRDNQELRDKIDRYENPEDMTLMMMWCTEKVKDENEKLNKKYVNAVADYETTMFEKEQLNRLVNSCQEEIRQLKKQLENKYEKVGTLTSELLYEENSKLINQQKIFINYLQEELNVQIQEESIGCEITNKRYILEEILNKYKEIIEK